MIRPGILLAAIAVVAAQAAVAGPVAIRSGEHADFSRLVLYFDGAVDWRLGRSDKGYRLAAGTGSGDFDTSQVFDFLPRTRLLAVDESAGGLDLEVACACHADAFEYRPGILVIDIKDGPPPAGSPFERSLPAPKRGVAQGQPGSSGGALLTLPVTFSAPALAPGPTAGGGGSAPATLAGRSASREATPAQPAPAATAAHGAPQAPTPSETAALRTELGEGLGRAIAQGLATPAETAATGTTATSSDLAALSAGITVRSGLDIATGAGIEDPAEQACRDPALFDAAAWGGEGTPLAMLERARAAFLDDLEQPSEAAVLELARTYVHLGFGAEAAQVMAAFPAEPEAAAAVSAIADQVDDPGRPGPELLRSQIGCDTPAALWALLATPAGAVAGAEIGVPAVLRTLSALPLPLRRQIAPAVSAHLRAAGLPAEAEAARAALSRATDQPGADMQVEIARAEADAAEPAVVAAMAETAARPGAPALLAQAEILARLARERAPVEAKLRREVEAQIHEAKGAPESSALLDAYVSALSANAGYDDALVLLARIRRSDFADAYHVAGGTDRVMTALAADASDGSFLVQARAFSEGPLFDLLSADIAAQIGERMVALGFMGEAEAYSASGTAATEAVRQVSLAAKARREGRPAEALARLSGLSLPEATRMKAEALADLGAHAEAAEIYLAMGEEERAAEAYWRAGRWEAARRLMEDAQRQEIAARMLAADDLGTAAAIPGPAATGDPAPGPGGTGPAGEAAAPAPAGGPPGAGQPGGPAGTSQSGVPTLAEAQAWIDESAALRAFAETVLATARDAR